MFALSEMAVIRVGGAAIARAGDTPAVLIGLVRVGGDTGGPPEQQGGQ